MKRIIKPVLFILLSFLVPYCVMYFRNTFTLQSYGNALCYVGVLHILVALFSWNTGIAVGDRTSKGHIYSSNLYSDLSSPQQDVKHKTGSAITIIGFGVLGIATIYAGYMLTL